MARTVKDTKLDTRGARGRLSARHEPYWRAIDQGMHLGYRKGKKGASWIARYRCEDGRYRKTVLGIPDDVQDAHADRDVSTVLTFSQAQEAAREWFQNQRHTETGKDIGPYTVGKAADAYLEWYEANNTGIGTARSHVEGYIRPALGDLLVGELTADQVETFHSRVAKAPARLRTRPGADQNYRPAPDTDEAKRKRKVTANRVLATLKACLNRAYASGKVSSDEGWRRVKAFKGVDIARVRYLTDEEAKHLVNACDPSFRPLVQAALLTGCRYGEITRLRAADFDPDAGTLFIGKSKSGKPRHVVLTEEAQQFFTDTTRALGGDDLIFSKNGGAPWRPTEQRRPLIAACTAATISPAVGFHVLRHTHASRLAMRGVPMRVIADQLGHADTRITEKHYAHLSPSYVADTIRQNFPALGIVEKQNVETLRG